MGSWSRPPAETPRPPARKAAPRAPRRPPPPATQLSRRRPSPRQLDRVDRDPEVAGRAVSAGDLEPERVIAGGEVTRAEIDVGVDETRREPVLGAALVGSVDAELPARAV